MKGHDPLIAMRMRGAAPSMVYVETGPCPDLLREAWSPEFPHLWVGDDEPIRRLDLRVLKALFVQFNGTDAERVEALAGVAIEAGASRVMAVVSSPPGPWQEILSVTDTAGVMTWRAGDAVAC